MKKSQFVKEVQQLHHIVLRGSAADGYAFYEHSYEVFRTTPKKVFYRRVDPNTFETIRTWQVTKDSLGVISDMEDKDGIEIRYRVRTTDETAVKGLKEQMLRLAMEKVGRALDRTLAVQQELKKLVDP